MRILFRLMLAVSLLLALGVGAVAVRKLGATDATAWATVAGALAVVTAVVSAWTSQRVLELQEDAQQPNPVPVIDVRSRYQLAQFRITNHGGASAHDVTITWARQLRDAGGKDVLLGRDVAIPVIPEGESASVGLGGSHDFLEAHEDTTHNGTLRFSNVSGRQYAKAFVVSAEHERWALVHDEETPKTLWQLQKVPDELQKVAREIKRLSGSLDRVMAAAGNSEADDDE
jgi:hypothetical protein